MGLSYRIKKKELVLLLDLAGDVNSLEQRFGDIYIDHDEYIKTAEVLHKKGMITLSGSSVIPECHVHFIAEKFFTSPLVLSDDKPDMWIYCSEDLIISVELSNLFVSEYILTPLIADGEKRDFFETVSGRNFFILRGGKGTVSGTELAKFTGEYKYECKYCNS